MKKWTSTCVLEPQEITINEFFKKEAIDTRQLVDSLYEIDKKAILDYSKKEADKNSKKAHALGK